MHFTNNINHKKESFFCLNKLINKKKSIETNDRHMKKKIVNCTDEFGNDRYGFIVYSK